MLSRNESIEQILSRMKPKAPSVAPASFSGPVTQVNIINNATINLDNGQWTFFRLSARHFLVL